MKNNRPEWDRYVRNVRQYSRQMIAQGVREGEIIQILRQRGGPAKVRFVVESEGLAIRGFGRSAVSIVSWLTCLISLGLGCGLVSWARTNNPGLRSDYAWFLVGPLAAPIFYFSLMALLRSVPGKNRP